MSIKKHITDEQIAVFRKAIAELSRLPVPADRDGAAFRRAEIAGMESQLASLEADRALGEGFAGILAAVHSASSRDPRTEEELEAFFDQVRDEVHAERRKSPETETEWAREFDAWIGSHATGEPLPESALTRESFYQADE